MIKKKLTLSTKEGLRKIKDRYARKYGIAIFNVKIKKISENLFKLFGIALSGEQKREAYLTALGIFKKEKTKSGKIKNEIKVLSNPKEKLEIGWGIAKDEIVDLWQSFFALPKNNIKKRATQAVKGDILRILYKKDNLILAQSEDLAIGWTNKRHVLSIPEGQANGAGRHQALDNICKNKKTAQINKLVKVSRLSDFGEKFIEFFKKYSDTPYLIGGKTAKGIDCSGIVQKFYLDFFGILLPRHSVRQSLCGENIKISEARFGDLIFMRHLETKYAHIGIIIKKAVDDEKILILNARKEKKGVCVENLKDIFKSYKILNIKRIIKTKYDKKNIERASAE